MDGVGVGANPDGSPIGSTEGPSRIGGWLILMAFGLLLSPFLYLYGALTGIAALLNPSVWQLATDASHPAYHVLWLPVLLFEAGGRVLLFAASVYVAWIFFKRSRRFPRLFVAMTVVAILFVWLDLLVSSGIPAVRAQTDYAGNIARTLGASIASLVWVAYVRSSKRVRNTFVVV